MKQALESKRFLAVAGDGEREIRQVHEASEFEAEVVSDSELAAKP